MALVTQCIYTCIFLINAHVELLIYRRLYQNELNIYLNMLNAIPMLQQ